MSIVRTPSGDVFEVQADPIEVTSLSRPDTSWRFTDADGHEHRWYADGQPATAYEPVKHYTLPTLRWVVEVEATDDYPEIGHHECIHCGETVRARRTADTHRQYIAGVRRCLINGRPVSADEFDRRCREELDKAQQP